MYFAEYVLPVQANILKDDVTWLNYKNVAVFNIILSERRFVCSIVVCR